jgi:hypothetical protein
MLKFAEDTTDNSGDASRESANCASHILQFSRTNLRSIIENPHIARFSEPLPMTEVVELETLMSARRVDVDDQETLAASCLEHAVAEDKLRAVIEVFRPLSDSFAVYLTK